MTDDNASEWRRIDFEGEAFDKLLKKLRGYLLKGKKNQQVDLTYLKETVVWAISLYDAEQYTAHDVSRRNLHKIEKPLARVIEILKNAANDSDIFYALAGNRDRHTIDLELAVERHDSLLRHLEKIAEAVPLAAPPKRPPNRPPRIDLRLLVGSLANYWLCATNTDFTQYWTNKGEPISLGAQFVYAVVEFIDPKSLPALPKITEWVVEKRGEGEVPGWFGDEGLRAATSQKSESK
jgi:hypothetical protein